MGVPFVLVWFRGKDEATFNSNVLGTDYLSARQALDSPSSFGGSRFDLVLFPGQTIRRAGRHSIYVAGLGMGRYPDIRFRFQGARG